ncbi:MAG: ImmA/IrrE family metallo-endopeptidase [Clostridiales bacterium]|jgi:Zn-dependent peptidase ImmA (M78 family)|nr:ImmA/IrrE family metallo-endopeptidase [Clostridiales bacterium]
MYMWIDKTEIEQRSLQVRQEHSIQTYGVKDIFSLIAQRGIHLIRYPFGKDKLLGFSTFFEGKKIIISNSSEILSREIFTIAHELGHVIYDFENEYNDVKIDFEITENSKDISEERAFHFANCFLMPEEEIRKYIKYELKKKHQEIGAFDIVRMQLEFQVSYAAMVVRLYEIGIIHSSHKSMLFDQRNAATSAALFKKLDADERLLKPANIIEVPPKYLEYVTSNYEKDYIPYASLEKALALIGMDAEVFKKEKQVQDEFDIEDIFEEFNL